MKFRTTLGVILIALLCAGCGTKKLEGVKCDSGFDTGLVYVAWIDEGLVRWRTLRGDKRSSQRKMLHGEICNYYEKAAT